MKQFIKTIFCGVVRTTICTGIAFLMYHAIRMYTIVSGASGYMAVGRFAMATIFLAFGIFMLWIAGHTSEEEE